MYIFQAMLFIIYKFRAKLGILGKYLYVNHTLFIFYLDGNHTLFGEKIYFIWKFSSGNPEEIQMFYCISNLITC